MHPVGRRTEREVVERLLTEASSGRAGALALVGEAGIGKTTLLEHAREVATSSAFQVESSTGIESEAQFAYGALHQLCQPLLGRLDALPEPRQTALRVAFGQQAGAAPERFLVGLSVLDLLSAVAEEVPLLCIVDDAQWLDEASAQVLAFVARRVTGRLAVLLALRDPTDDGDLRPYVALPELRLDGLTEDEARTLLAEAVRTPLDDGVRDRIIEEARGNPLALLDLPRSAPPTGLAGGFELLESVRVPTRIVDGLRRRSEGLPSGTQLLLLLAAADPTGDAATVWRAAGELAIELGAAAPAEAAGLLEIDTRVRFRHPLVRAAVYQGAPDRDRRRVHGALAAATDPGTHPEHHAWHRARAVLGTDEETAAELVRSADRARARGGLAAAAALLHQASELTPDPAHRAGRALEAAQAKHAAGAPGTASQLLTVAEAGPLDGSQRARVQLVRARVAFQRTRGSDVLGMLLDAAGAPAQRDAARSRQAYLHALEAAITSGRDSVRTVARAALGAPEPPGAPTPADLLLDGLATTHAQGYQAGVPLLRRALEAFRDVGTTAGADGDSSQWLWVAGRTAAMLFDDELVDVLTERHVLFARQSGVLVGLPAALVTQSLTSVLTGAFDRASELTAESTAIAHAIGAAPLPHAELVLAGWRGDRAGADTIEAALARESVEPVDDTVVSVAHYALAVLQNARCTYGQAVTSAVRASESADPTYRNLALPEIVEAASRAPDTGRAAAAVEELEMRARATGTPWALGLAARSRALITSGPGAEQHYLDALDHLGPHRMTSYSARTHLVFGEWLRREGRRQEAREQLRTAHRLLAGMGAEAFVERAAQELSATSEHARKRTAQTADTLTTHELQIARLVATGATSREVGERLFLSPRTIEAHLRTIFRKLDITSRRQLTVLQLPEPSGTAQPPAHRLVGDHRRRQSVRS